MTQPVSPDKPAGEALPFGIDDGQNIAAKVKICRTPPPSALDDEVVAVLTECADDGAIPMTPAHERLMAELVAIMAANTRTPLLEIRVTVNAADLDSELGRLRAMETDSEDHNPDGFVHASPEVERMLTEALERKMARASGPGHQLSELLAVIHRDGGHYQDEHGLDKAVADAMQLSSERIAASDPKVSSEDAELLARWKRFADNLDDGPFDPSFQSDCRALVRLATLRASDPSRELVERIAGQALNNPPGEAMTRRDMILQARAALAQGQSR